MFTSDRSTKGIRKAKSTRFPKMPVFVTSQVLTARRKPLRIGPTWFPTDIYVASTMPFSEFKNSNASRSYRRFCVSPYMRSGAANEDAAFKKSCLPLNNFSLFVFVP